MWLKETSTLRGSKRRLVKKSLNKTKYENDSIKKVSICSIINVILAEILHNKCASCKVKTIALCVQHGLTCVQLHSVVFLSCFFSLMVGRPGDGSIGGAAAAVESSSESLKQYHYHHRRTNERRTAKEGTKSSHACTTTKVLLTELKTRCCL